MADKNTVQTPKKADLILQRQRELSAKQEETLSQSKISNSRLNTLLEQITEARNEVNYVIAQERELQGNIQTDFDALKQEFRFIAMQSEGIFTALSEKVQELNNLLAGRPLDEIAATRDADIDYDYLAEKVAEKLPVQVADGARVYSGAQQDIDYDLLVDKLIARLPVQEVAPLQGNIDYDELADRLARRMPTQEIAAASALPVNVSVADRAIDYEYLADKIVSRLPAQEVVSPDYIASKVAEQIVVPPQEELLADYIASKVAEQIVLPEITAEVDSDTIAELVADKLGSVPAGDIDYDYLAAKVAQQIEIPEVQNYTAATYAENPAHYEINEDELADAIALKVGSLKPEDFEILVDDEGCASISKEIIERLDYDGIAAAVAEKLREANAEEEEDDEPDYDEMAARISEKISVSGVNEDAIADKAAAALSNYLPEFDTDEIADKVAEQVISALPAVSVDNEEITNAVASRIIEAQQDNDYEIVIDEDGVDRMSDSVSEKVYQTNDERFTAIDNEIAEIKEILQNLQIQNVIVAAPVEETVEEEVEEEPVEEPVEETVEEETVEEEIEEINEPEPLVTDAEEPADEQVETVPEVAEETPPAETVVIANVSESDEDDGEDSEVEGEGEEGGVDFLNMMRYNRSFIARIIQSSDETKNYYGTVRNALLSYRKVNSNIAWGAERFHKGRETIARFKIRGKTLVLYMAIDPKEIEYSVYHQKDVSDNKSLHGTPTMIKIKSPRGVKKAVRLVDLMLEKRDGIKREVPERDYAAMYPYETMEELIEDGLVKDVNKDK